MNITVLAVGKLKEKYWQDAIREYSKRLGKYCRFQIVEVKESLLRANPSEADEAAVKIAEGRDILSKIKPSDHVVTLEIKGRPLSSPQLAQHIEDMTVRGKSSIVFVIGGSLGLSGAVVARANEKLSMSKMTFPHQLARVMLLEQLYRCQKIGAGERYHK